MAKSDTAGKLVVNGVFSEWTYTEGDNAVVTLKAGENVVESPADNVVAAIGAGHDAGVLVIDEEQSDPKLVKAAHAAYENVDTVMAKQDQMVADADPEAKATHLGWEVERRVGQANEALELASSEGDQVFADQARVLLAHAEGIAGSIDEIATAAPDDQAVATIKKVVDDQIAGVRDKLESVAPAPTEEPAA
jgi:hypothetical protein